MVVAKHEADGVATLPIEAKAYLKAKGWVRLEGGPGRLHQRRMHA